MHGKELNAVLCELALGYVPSHTAIAEEGLAVVEDRLAADADVAPHPVG